MHRGTPSRIGLVGLVVGVAIACTPDGESAPGDTEGSSSSTAADATTEIDATTSTHVGTSTSDDTGTPADESTDTGEPPVAAGCDALLDLVAAVQRSTETTEEAWLVESFLDEVRWSADGLPIIEADRTCFVHVGDPGAALAVTGDFAKWDPAAYPMTPVPTDLGLHYAVVEMPADAATGLYKLVDDAANYRADPRARRFGYDEFGEYSQLGAIPGRSHLERWPGFDVQVAPLDPRTVTVYVPADASARADLPVMVLHDGQNVFDPEAFFGGWQVRPTLDGLIAAGDVPAMVVVAIDNTPARFDEYTHVPDDLGGMITGGQADAYADFVVDGVLPFVAERYPVSTAASDTAVLGSSLGGVVSLYLGLRHPDVFGWAGSMSGTVWWGEQAGNPTLGDRFTTSPPTGLSIYLDSGGDEGIGCPAGGSDNYCANVELADTLRDLGWQDEADLVYRWDPGAMHNEAAWAARFGPMLTQWRFAP